MKRKTLSAQLKEMGISRKVHPTREDFGGIICQHCDGRRFGFALYKDKRMKKKRLILVCAGCNLTSEFKMVNYIK